MTTQTPARHAQRPRRLPHTAVATKPSTRIQGHHPTAWADWGPASCKASAKTGDENSALAGEDGVQAMPSSSATWLRLGLGQGLAALASAADRRRPGLS